MDGSWLRYLLVLATLASPCSGFSGDLASVRLEVRDPNASSKSDSRDREKTRERERRRSRRRRDCDDDDDSFAVSLLGAVLGGSNDDDCDDSVSLDLSLLFAVAGGVALTPFVLGQGMVGDHGKSVAAMRARPFATEPYGFLVLDDVACDSDFVLDEKSFVVDGNISYATDFDSLEGWGGELQFDHLSRFGLYGRWRSLEEKATDDSMDLGSLNLAFRFAQGQSAVAHTGFGFVWLDDPGGSEFGFNWLYRMDWAVARPLSLGAQMELGKLGDA
ncbi:MAG: hypothetical protein AAF802_33010, partial [Planctomycetota bacterium]